MPISFADFSVRALNLCRPPIRRPATRTKLKQVLKEFSEICQTTSDINLDTVANWVSSRPGRAPLTTFSLLRAFARATKLATKQRLLEVDPFEIIPPPQWFATGDLVVPPKVRHLTSDQISRLLRQAGLEGRSGEWEARRMACLIPIYAFTGCRRNEALGLRVEDVDLVGRVISIRPNARRPLKTKASVRRLPMASRLIEEVEAWMPARVRGHDGGWLIPHKDGDGPWLHGRPGTKPLDRVKALGKGLKYRTRRFSRSVTASPRPSRASCPSCFASDSWGIGTPRLNTATPTRTSTSSETSST